MTQSSFYGDTPNYATSYPTQNDSNTQPVTGNSQAPSSFYPNGALLAQADPQAALNSANQAAASATAAANSATTASTQATNAATSATNAASSASSASSSATAASNSASSASTSATNAASSASSASSAATSASSSASAASTSATNASTSATNAANSASAANTSATNASTSATNAANSASSAATSASNAATAVQNAAGTATPLMDGTAAVGTSTLWAHQDHVHPTDTTRAPVASPTFTGTPAAPTPTAGDNSTKLATTAFVATSFAPLASPALTGTPTAPTATAGTNTTQLATTAFVLANALSASVLRSYLAGLTLSTAGSSATFSVAPGVAMNSTNTTLMSLASAMSKTTGAWVAGTGNGALDTGTIAASTWYHVHLIENTSGPTVDVLISLSATAPTLPSGYTVFRRIGSMKTNASSQWLGFIQLGDEFLWATPVQDVSGGAVSTTATLTTLSVPTGVQVLAQSSIYCGSGTASYGVFITSPDVTDTAPTTGFFDIIQNTTVYTDSVWQVRTNTSGQIRIRSSAAQSAVLYIVTRGWTDRRGRDS